MKEVMGYNHETQQPIYGEIVLPVKELHKPTEHPRVIFQPKTIIQPEYWIIEYHQFAEKEPVWKHIFDALPDETWDEKVRRGLCAEPAEHRGTETPALL